MEKIRKKRLGKGYWLLTFVALFVTGFFVCHSYAEEESRVRYGFSVLGGAGDAWHNETTLTVYGFLPRADVPLHRNWDLELEGNYSYWSIHKEHNLYFLGANANILFKPIQRDWGSLFLLVGGGLGYDSGGGRVKEIGGQHFGGILQAGLGFYYNLGKRLALRIEYRFYHTSEPFRSDHGLNAHTALFGVSF